MSGKNSWSVRVSRILRPSRALWAVGCVALAIVLSMGNTLRAFAAPGDLDTTFGGDGLVTTDIAGSADGAFGVAIQGDGKIVAAGDAYVAATGDYDFAVTRYNTNGTLDDNFAANGKVTTDFFGHYDVAHSVVIQSNGKIVVGGFATGSTYADFALTRYNPDGSLDTTFSGNGKTYTDFGVESEIFALAIQSDGKVVAAGLVIQSSGQDDFALARYNANGSLDTTFSGDGKVIIDFGASDRANAVAVQSNDKIVVAGGSGSGSSTDFALARLDSSGGLDTTFSFDGKVTTDFFADSDYANAVVIQSDDKIVAAGTATQSSTSGDFGLARYLTDGTLDSSFSGNGKTYTDFGADEHADGVVIQSNGKIVVAGAKHFGSSNGNFVLARYNASGALDTDFGVNGKVTTDFSGTFDEADAVALQSDGKIVAAGTSATTNNYNFALARYEGDAPEVATATPTTVQPTQTPGGATATPVVTPCTIEFSDVDGSNVFYPFVRCLACREILGGYTDGTFRPGNNVTRGQLSKIVSNAAGFGEFHVGQSFEDVPPSDTFYLFVERMASRNIIGGYACGGVGEPCGPASLPYFRTNANATRGQISKIVSNAAEYSDDPGAQIFEDVIPGSGFYDFVQRLANREIMGGYPCGGDGEPCGPASLPYFRPGSNATRGQTAKIISNTFFPNCQTP